MAVKIKENPDNVLYDHAHMLNNYVDSWIHIAFQIIPPHEMNTNMMQWKCFGCQKPIMIKFDEKDHKNFCCKNCKHLSAGKKPNAIMLRFMWSFNVMVQNRLIKNSTNLDKIMELKSDHIATDDE